MDLQYTPSERLVRYGFINDKGKGKYPASFDWDNWNKAGAREHADEEIDEEVMHTFEGNLSNPLDRTGYPKPTRRYRIAVEAFGLSMEEAYFWFLGHVRQDQGYPEVIKITDIFSASENSAFWGQSAQRLGLQQDKVTNYFATVGKMVKDLFAIVRELRIIDERLDIYFGAVGINRNNRDKAKMKDPNLPNYEGEPFTDPRAKKAYDVTLKGLYVDMVEGGTEKPTSVYGMARQVGFTILPDLFFNTYVYNEAKVEEIVSEMQYNPTVKNVLKRKLAQFVIWKKRTEQELLARRMFNIRYLRQHWGIINMYLGWIKPYLKNIQRLSMSQRQMDSPDIVTAFETSVLEIEFLAKKQPINGYHPCLLISFKYTTKPTLSYQQEYQRGPVHVGRVDVNMRSYAWKPEQVENYRRMRNEEDLELLGVIDSSVHAAMEELGEPLKKYLEEAGEKIKRPVEKPEKEEKDMKKQIAYSFDPFVAVIKGFGEMFGSIIPVGAITNRKKKDTSNPDSAKKAAEGTMWQTYKNYKKSHKLLSW